MAVTFTEKEATYDSVDRTTYTTGSLTAQANKLYVIFMQGAQGSARTLSSVSGGGLGTWTIIPGAGIASGTSTRRTDAAYAWSASPGAAAAISIQYSGAMNGSAWMLYEIDGADTSNPIGQTNATTGSSNNFSISLPSATAGSGIAASVQNLSNSVINGDSGGGWTVGTMINGNTPNISARAQTRTDISDLAANWSFSTQTYVANIIEILAAPASTTVTTYGQAQASIKATSNGFAQAQADIKTTNTTYAQAQGSIKTVGRGVAQSQATIRVINRGFAQARADIKATSNAFAQSQADIKATSTTYGQSQADIRQTYRSHSQAQAQIKQTSFGFAQAGADIKSVNRGYAQSIADIKQTYFGFAQASADIKQTYRGVAQAQASIVVAVVSRQSFAQAQGSIKSTGRASANAQADIRVTTHGFGQAQALIKQTYRGHANAQAWISTTHEGHSQAQARIKAVSVAWGASQGQIRATSRGFSQAQAFIARFGEAHGQARAFIRVYPLTVTIFDEITTFLSLQEPVEFFSIHDEQDETIELDLSTIILNLTDEAGE